MEDVAHQRAREPSDIPEVMAGLGQRLRTLRERRGWNQTELAERSGVDSGRISRIESGKRMGRLSAAHVVRLALALEVSLDHLLTGERSGLVITLGDQVPLSVVSELAEDIKKIRARLEPPGPKRKDSGTLRVRSRPKRDGLKP